MHASTWPWNVIGIYIMITVKFSNQTHINDWNIVHNSLVVRRVRCTVNTKCWLHLSHSKLHICTPGSLSGCRIPSLLPPPHHLSSLFYQFPILPSSAVFCALWGGCSGLTGGVTDSAVTLLLLHEDMCMESYHYIGVNVCISKCGACSACVSVLNQVR